MFNLRTIIQYHVAVRAEVTDPVDEVLPPVLIITYRFVCSVYLRDPPFGYRSHRGVYCFTVRSILFIFKKALIEGSEIFASNSSSFVSLDLSPFFSSERVYR